LKSISAAAPEILKGSFPNPGPHPLFFWWSLMMGLGEPYLHAKFEAAGFIYYGYIREFVFKPLIRFLSHPLGDLWVTYGLHL